MRSKITLFVFLLLTTLGAMSQQTVTVVGHLVNSQSNIPVANHQVYISTDSLSGSFFYSNSVQTNPNGHYEDHIQLPAGVNEGLVNISTEDCNGAMIMQSHPFGPGNMLIEANFELCADTMPIGCQANFFFEPSMGNQLEIHFHDASFPEPISWSWNFGDSTTANGPHPSHLYALAGTYNVQLMVTTTGGCTSTAIIPVTVGYNAGCQAFFTYHKTPEPLTFHFENQSMGMPSSLLWNFGDGNTSTESHPHHTFAAPGLYQVSLTISTPDSSCWDIYTTEVSAGDSIFGCHANFFYHPIDSIGLTSTYQFINQSTGTASMFTWSFGDGTTSNEENPIHQYTEQGEYQVCLTISSLDSTCSDTECHEVHIGFPHNECHAMFHYYPADSLTGGLNIQFVDASHGDPQGWAWSFGDGATSNEQNPIHTYQEGGIYNVCLTIENPSTNCVDTICYEVWVNTFPSGCENEIEYHFEPNVIGKVHFEGQLHPHGQAEYLWSFGDGTIGTGKHITHEYPGVGTYTVVLTTVTNQGCTDTSSLVLTITNDTLLNQTIQGTIYAGASHPDLGIVMLLPLNCIWNYNAQVTMIDSMGSYIFTNVPQGDYHILAIPFSINGDTTMWMPTYYGDVFFWQQAAVVSLGTALPAYDINLVSGNGAIPGLGLINGNIIANGLKSSMVGVPVMLMNTNNQPLEVRRSNSQGSFDFSNLDFGTYIIWPEVHGVTTQPTTLILSEDSPSAQVTLKLDGTSISGIDDNNSLSYVSQVYPNPVKEDASLQMTTINPITLNISLINSTGQVVYQQESAINGTKNITLNASELPAGYYTLRVVTEEGNVTQRKFIKVR